MKIFALAEVLTLLSIPAHALHAQTQSAQKLSDGCVCARSCPNGAVPCPVVGESPCPVGEAPCPAGEPTPVRLTARNRKERVEIEEKREQRRARRARKTADGPLTPCGPNSAVPCPAEPAVGELPCPVGEACPGDPIPPREEVTVARLTEKNLEGGGSIRYVGAEEANFGPWLTEFMRLSPPDWGGPAKSPKKNCMSANTEFADDDWCRSVCASNATGDGRQTRATALTTDASRAWPEKWCDPDFCSCIDAGLSHEDLVRRVQVQERKVPSGLPECLWPPPSGCTKDAVYECMQGPNAGRCGEENWFDKKDECMSSCVHASLLWWAPKDKEWIPGPVADDKTFDDTVPRYEHDKSKLKMENRGLALKKLSVTMSPACQGGGVKFVGISLHSPKYSAKADRLLRSCSRVGICCKASLLPSNAFGQDAPEGSEEFRFQLIAMKPAFILSSLELHGKPVAFLDVDLEFHSYPHLFDPGSWPDGPRDVALFNYWGNETNGQVVPSLGSGVVYFNDTSRSMHLARAWAEAMAFPANQQAPDDQVLTTMCSQGGWIKRASWGWLPVAYLRTMPAFYHGVDPVLDHDHGSAPGSLTLALTPALNLAL